MSYVLNLLKNELTLLNEQLKLCTGKEIHYNNTKRKVQDLEKAIKTIENK